MSVRVGRVVRRPHLPPLAVVAIAVVVRWLTMSRVLWGDEQITLRIVANNAPLQVIPSVVLHQPHLPTYYLLVEAISHFFSDPASVAVGMSIAASAATVAVTYRLGLRWFDDELTAVIAALLVALSPLHAAQGTWVRMYALFALVTAASWLFLDYVRTNGVMNPAYMATTLAAVSLHPFGVFLPAAQAVWLWVVDRRIRPAMHALLASTPVMVYLALKALGSWGPSSGVQHITIPPSAGKVVLAPLATLTGSVFLIGQVVVFVLVWITIGLAVRRHDVETGVAAAFCWLSLPIMFAAGISYTVQPILMLKYLGWLTPAAALLVAWAGRRAGIVGWVAIVLLIYVQAGILWLYATTDILVARTTMYGLMVYL